MILIADATIAIMPSVLGLPTFFASFIDRIPNTTPRMGQQSSPMTIPRTPQSVVLSLPAGVAAGGGYGAVNVSSCYQPHDSGCRVNAMDHDGRWDGWSRRWSATPR